MENNDIIKALEYCVEQGITSECEKCKLKKGCRTEMITTALSLINRQKAEIERLEFRCDDCDRIGLTRSEYKTCIKQAKSEAIIEYYEEVKKRCIEGGIFPAFVNRQMEDVRKEMVGE